MPAVQTKTPGKKSSAVAAPLIPKKSPAKKAAASAKPAAPRKSAAPAVVEKKPAAPKKPGAVKASAKIAAQGNGQTTITPEQRFRMICDAAYFRAERRGFVGGNPAEDWVAAEAEIDVQLRGSAA